PAVGRPAGVPDAAIPGHGKRVRNGGHPARALDAANALPAGKGDARRIVPPVFQAGQPFVQYARRLSFARIRDNPAHIHASPPLASLSRRAARTSSFSSPAARRQAGALSPSQKMRTAFSVPDGRRMTLTP